METQADPVVAMYPKISLPSDDSYLFFRFNNFNKFNLRYRGLVSITSRIYEEVSKYE